MTVTELEEFWEKLDPKTRRRFKMAHETSNEKLESASLEFNWATGGGFPRAAITTVFGNYSSTKTAFLLETIAKLQNQGLMCAFVDSEGTYDKVWAEKLGVNNKKLILIQKRSFGAVNDEVKPLLKAGIDFLVHDSISMTIPEVFIDDDGEIKEFDKQKQIGAAARSASIYINSLHYDNDRTAIVLVSQTRTDLSGRYPMQKPTNGKAVEFGSSLMVKLSAPGSENAQIMGETFIGDIVHQLPVGREVSIDVVKNKVGPPNRTGKYNFYYAGDFVGIDNVDELVSMAKRFGVLTGSNWIYFGDEKWNGQKAMTQALKNDSDLFDRINKEVQMLSTGEVPHERLGSIQEEGVEA